MSSPMAATRPHRTADELLASARQFESQGKLSEAGDAFGQALALEPSSQAAAEGRARIAIQLREEAAADHCARALAFHDHDPAMQLQMIWIASIQLGAAARPMLESYLRRNPHSIRAYEILADLNAQAGAGDAFANHYVAALKEFPTSREIWISYWNSLSKSGRSAEALESMDANRALLEGDRDFLMLEVAIASHSGMVERAAPLIDRLDERPDARLARGQHRLQTGDPAGAAKLLESVVAAEPDNLTAWAMLEPAWRAAGDGRHDWLIGQPGLYGAVDLALSDTDLLAIADALRALHIASSQPLGQSVRGGTQTSGDLFTSGDPKVLQLVDALAAAIREFLGNLPPADRAHPLLKHRNREIGFGPSWSIRLTGGGFHAAHFHPGGFLSSACYISVPDGLAGNAEREGWLEIGRPPPELKLDLPALAAFEPRPRRLVLFPSFLFHGTRPFAGGERLTVAFDLVAR